MVRMLAGSRIHRREQLQAGQGSGAVACRGGSAEDVVKRGVGTYGNSGSVPAGASLDEDHFEVVKERNGASGGAEHSGQAAQGQAPAGHLSTMGSQWGHLGGRARTQLAFYQHTNRWRISVPHTIEPFHHSAQAGNTM